MRTIREHRLLSAAAHVALSTVEIMRLSLRRGLVSNDPGWLKIGDVPDGTQMVECPPRAFQKQAPVQRLKEGKVMFLHVRHEHPFALAAGEAITRAVADQDRQRAGESAVTICGMNDRQK
jgi:hypothetical protein